MASKRFTDSSKWRNEWFRTLPMKAKLAWMYLCDECDFAGVHKIDYGLASFQLDFKISEELIKEWFGDKIFFVDREMIVIIKFFNFQYGQSKDTWSVKISARDRLENLGFTIVNNTTVPPQCPHSGVVTLIKVKGSSLDLEESLRETKENSSQLDFESVYKIYPNKRGKSGGIEKLKKIIKDETTLDQFKKAVENYADACRKECKETRYMLYFETFVNQWQDWVSPEQSEDFKIFVPKYKKEDWKYD